MEKPISVLEAEMRDKVVQEIRRNETLLNALSSRLRAQLADALRYEGFMLDAWLVSSSSYLNGQRPIDLLPGSLDVVLSAARLEAQPIAHG